MEVLQGVWPVQQILDKNVVEKYMRQGGGYLGGVTFSQIAAIYFTMTLIGSALGVANRPPLSSKIQAACVLSPLVPALLITQTRKNRDSMANRATFWLHDRIFSLCVLSIVASQLVFIRFGKVSRGVTGLALVGAHYIFDQATVDNKQHFTRVLRALRQLRLSISLLSCLGALRYGNTISKVNAVGRLVSLTLIGYCLKASQSRPPEKPDIQKLLITQEKVNVLEWEVSKWHAYSFKDIQPGEPPSVDFDTFIQLFDDINWSLAENQSAVAGELDNHPNWTERPQAADEGIYLQDGIKKLAGQLKGEKPGLRHLDTFEVIKKQAAHVLSHLSACPKEYQRGPLLRLAMSGTICPLAPQREIDELYQDLGFKPKTIEGQLNASLATCRYQIFQQCVTPSDDPEKTTGWDTFYDGIKFSSTEEHMHNSLLLTFGRDWGLPGSSRAFSDPVAGEILFLAKVIGYLYGTILSKAFWSRYTPFTIIDEAGRAINGDWDESKRIRVNQQIDRDKVVAWAKGKCVEADMPQDDIMDFLSEKVFDETGAMRSKYVMLLLIDIGFLVPKKLADDNSS